MCLVVREALRVGRIACHPEMKSIEMTSDEAKRRIVDELGSYCVVCLPPYSTTPAENASHPSFALWQVTEPAVSCLALTP